MVIPRVMTLEEGKLNEKSTEDIVEEGQTKDPSDSHSDAFLQKDALEETSTVTSSRASVIVAMESMRQRASRYKQAPIYDVEDIMQRLDAETGGTLLKQRATYLKIFDEYPTSVGKALSKRERDASATDHTTLVYGEINFEAFAITLLKIKTKFGLPQRISGEGQDGEEATYDAGILQGVGGLFVDLGSGLGKPCVAAALVHPFQHCVGIELLEGLFSASLGVKALWDSGAYLGEEEARETMTQIEYVRGDAFDLKLFDWSQADVVFANSTCFDDNLMKRMAASCASLKKGAFIITFTKKLNGPEFDVVDQDLHVMSWGGATVYIQRKVR